MIDEIKDRFTIPMLGRELFPDWKPAKSCRSPFRDDRSPSFSVYNEGKLFMDFATGERGDVVDFYALAKGISAPAALNALWDRLGSANGHCERPLTSEKPTAKPKKPTRDDPFCLPYRPSRAEFIRMKNDCERLLRAPEAIEAIAQYRGWDQEIIKDLAFEGCLGLSTEGYITFNFLSGSKSRWLDANGKRQFRWNFGKPWFWRGELVAQNDWIWIVEGETKAIKAIQWGYENDGKVIALPAANFNPAPWAFLFVGKQVAYIADPDPAGKAAAKRVKTALKPVAREIVILYPEDLNPREK